MGRARLPLTSFQKEEVSAYFDESQIREVLGVTDIVELVGSYVALKPRGQEMVGLCPFHEDKKPSLNVSRKKQIFKCFACGAGGSAYTFLMRREQMTFPEAVRFLAERAGIQLREQQSQTGGGIDRGSLEKVNQWAARFFRRMYDDEQEGQRPRQYVAERGIDVDIAKRFGLGWAPAQWESLRQAAEQDRVSVDLLTRLGLLVERSGGGCYDRFRERLIFPVIDALGRVIAFGGRTLGDDQAKYLNSPESDLFDKSRALYGIHAAKDGIVKRREAVVVEGYTDCLMAHQFGVTNVVATLGTALTAENARVLSRYADRIVLVFDSDAAGQKAAERAIEVFFSQRVEVALVSLPAGKDPCDFLLAEGAEAFEALIADAVDALDYKWQATVNELMSADTVGGRSRAAEAFLAFVAQGLAQQKIDTITEGFLVNHVAQLIGTPSARVHEQVRRLQRRTRMQSRPSEPAQPSKPTVTGDRYENAQRAVLEVLLNRPELVSMTTDVIAGPDEFRNEVQRLIAGLIWRQAENAATGLADILAGVESPELAEIMTDMAERGAARGNLEATLAGALRTIEHYREEHARQGVREVIATAGEKYGEDAEAAALMEYQSKWRPDPRRIAKRS